MSPTAEALSDAIREVHHAPDMPSDAELLRVYELLIIAISIEDRFALTLAARRLRAARDEWAGTTEKTRTLTALAPTIAHIVFSLDYALVFALLAERRLTLQAAPVARSRVCA